MVGARLSAMDSRVQLRDVEQADLETFFEQENDEEAVRRSRFEPREREAFMAHWKTKVIGDPANHVRAVVVDGELAGNIVAWWQEGRRFIGYWLGREYWGRGIGTAALGLFLDAERNRPLYADPHGGNTGSVKLLERRGFRRTETDWYDDEEHVLLVLEA